jgi:hypothetical protein
MYRIPGSKPWVQTTMGFTQTGDWEEGIGAGVIRYDDGTLWVWNTEMTHPMDDHYWPGYIVSINELRPGAKAWECLTPDGWTTDDDGDTIGSSGRLIEKNLFNDRWRVVSDGGDITYWFPLDYVANKYGYDTMIVVNKATRTWEYKDLGYTSGEFMETHPVLWGGYIWFLGPDSYASTDTTANLWRISTTSPYPLEKVKTWPSTRSTMWDNDPTTNLPKFFSEFVFGRENENVLSVDEEGYLYFMTNEWDLTNGRGMAVIKRMSLPDGDWETLYYYYVPNGSAANFTYNLPNATRNDMWHGPLPIGLGLRPAWLSVAKIRDGYLYWVESSSWFTMLSSGWTGGHMFVRLKLSSLEGGWVVHQPEAPIVEVLSMTTGAWDSFYNWDDNSYWGNHGGYDWRDGLDSIHAYPEANWQFDEDGSIIFLHHEYPKWYIERSGYYPPWVLSRLSPPENIPITFRLVFEGTELKGYGHIRQVPPKTKIGTIELTGE